MSIEFPYRDERINDPKLIDEAYIESKVNEGIRVIVQFVKPPASDSILERLNTLCRKFGSNFEIRFFGFYGDTFDGRLLRRIPDVKALSVDCLTRAINSSEITNLRSLEELSIGVYELKELEILSSENFFSLKALSVSETRSSALNLNYLRHYRELKSLYICGHTKNIEAIGELSGLEQLGLSSIKKTNLNFVNQLKELKGLTIILGGRDNINEIAENNIENLEIIWVRGFNEFANISRFKSLKKLRIEGQIKLERLEFDNDMPFLNTVSVFNCKSLRTINGLINLSALNDLRLGMIAIDFDEFAAQPMPKSLKKLAIYTGKEKKNRDIRSKLDKMGFSEF